MTSGNNRTITWNDDNLPVTITSSSTVNGNNTVTGSSQFSYSPDLQRYLQVATDSNIAGNIIATYIGDLFEVVSSGGTTQYRHNILAAGGIVAVHTLDQSGNATTAYIHADNLGSSDTITNDAGTVVQQSSFDAFGLRRNPNDWSYNLSAAQIASPDPSNPTISNLKGITDRGYTAQEQLDNVGLVHMNGRVYDPSIGRFISSDPKIPNPFYSQAYDRYAYVYDNPLAMTDPSGYDGCGDTMTCIQTDPPAADPLPTISTTNLTGNLTTLSTVLPPFTKLGSRIPGVDTGCKACDTGLTRGGIDSNASSSGSQGADGSGASGNADKIFANKLSYDLFPPNDNTNAWGIATAQVGTGASVIAGSAAYVEGLGYSAVEVGQTAFMDVLTDSILASPASTALAGSFIAGYGAGKWINSGLNANGIFPGILIYNAFHPGVPGFQPVTTLSPAPPHY